MHLRGAVLINADSNFLQGVVPTIWTERFVHVCCCPEIQTKEFNQYVITVSKSYYKYLIIIATKLLLFSEANPSLT